MIFSLGDAAFTRPAFNFFGDWRWPRALPLRLLPFGPDRVCGCSAHRQPWWIMG